MAVVRGGEKLEAALALIARNVTNAATLRVGFLASATYPDGKPVAMIAAIQNWGSGTIPPRPFFTNMVVDKSPGWPRALGLNLRANNYDARRALPLMGEGIAGQLRQSIKDFSGVPLKPATIARKGHAKQLVDTGVMLGSVDYEIS